MAAFQYPLPVSQAILTFEVYNPFSIVQLSEVLSEFKIVMSDRVVYSGRAVVSLWSHRPGAASILANHSPPFVPDHFKIS